MTDEALLAQLITYAAPKADAARLSRQLLDRHGSLAPILESMPGDLTTAHGVTEPAAWLIHLMMLTARYVAREEAKALTHVGTFARAGAHLKRLYLGTLQECFYLMCMDKNGRLIDCSLVQQGTVDEAPFYLRHILEKVTVTGAYAVVLSHNHPSGTPYPSRGDVDCTLSAIETLIPMDVLVLDHILISDGIPISIRNSDRVAEVLFSRQRPGEPLIEHWYDAQEDAT